MNIPRKLKPCKSCGKDSYLFSKGMCKGCASKGYKKISTVKKPTGELELFKEIWAERIHYCKVTEEYLGSEPKVSFFSHLLPKGAYPAFRLRKDNIWLMTPEIHHEWDFGNRNAEIFKEARAKAEELKREYYLTEKNL